MGENKTYKTGKLTFLLTPTSTIVTTPLGQSFYLAPKNSYYRRRIYAIRKVIEVNEIRNLEELAEWCAGINGVGVEWLSINNKFDNSENVLV